MECRLCTDKPVLATDKNIQARVHPFRDRRSTNSIESAPYGIIEEGCQAETMPFFSVCNLIVSPSVKDLPLVAGSLVSSAQGQLLL